MYSVMSDRRSSGRLYDHTLSYSGMGSTRDRLTIIADPGASGNVARDVCYVVVIYVSLLTSLGTWQSSIITLQNITLNIILVFMIFMSVKSGKSALIMYYSIMTIWVTCTYKGCCKYCTFSLE